MKGSEIGSAAFREPPSGGPRKAQPEVCLESRSPQQSLGLRGKSLIFRLKVTRVRQPGAKMLASVGSAGHDRRLRWICGSRCTSPLTDRNSVPLGRCQ